MAAEGGPLQRGGRVGVPARETPTQASGANEATGFGGPRGVSGAFLSLGPALCPPPPLGVVVGHGPLPSLLPAAPPRPHPTGGTCAVGPVLLRVLVHS